MNFGNVSYEVFPANELFSVTKLESGEGEVRVEGTLDREILDEYSITIIARDGGNLHIVFKLAYNGNPMNVQDLPQRLVPQL